MKNLETQVVVVGGGVTGTAVLHDLTVRGLNAMLSEGTSGNFHGLLHSGGRYAVKDQPAARECIKENQVLRHIAPQAIEDTGGFFVTFTNNLVCKKKMGIDEPCRTHLEPLPLGA
jgi:glycerol-3-phosphate dehydrogenase